MISHARIVAFVEEFRGFVLPKRVDVVEDAFRSCRRGEHAEQLLTHTGDGVLLCVVVKGVLSKAALVGCDLFQHPSEVVANGRGHEWVLFLCQIGDERAEHPGGCGVAHEIVLVERHQGGLTVQGIGFGLAGEAEEEQCVVIADKAAVAHAIQIRYDQWLASRVGGNGHSGNGHLWRSRENAYLIGAEPLLLAAVADDHTQGEVLLPHQMSMERISLTDDNAAVLLSFAGDGGESFLLYPHIAERLCTMLRGKLVEHTHQVVPCRVAVGILVQISPQTVA